MADTAMVDTTERGPQKPSPTTAMAAMVDTVDTDTAMARGLLMPSPLPPPRQSPRLLPTTAVPMADTMARGQLMPRLTMAMAAMVDTDMAMARGPLTPRLTTAVPMATDMADTTERGPLRPSPTTAIAGTDMVDTMARGPLTPRLTTATPDTDMVDTMARGPLTLRLTTASPDTDMAD